MQNKISSYFWILFGPGALLGALILLFYRSSSLIGHPVWLFGLTIAIFLACGIIYLTFKELIDQEKNLLHQIIQYKKEAKDMRAVLEEAHTLYREKVEKLERTIATIEKEQKMHFADREETFQRLQKNYEKVQEESKAHKNQALAFQTSLEDALDELRNVHQFQYIQQELGKALPKDLPNQYKQLREQFDEKALILDQTRRRLFLIEGQLLALKKQQTLEKLGVNVEEEKLFQTLQNVLEENHHLEEEITDLETLVSHSLQSKHKKKPQKKLDQMLEFQFETTK